jgi:hypothetical protein
MKKLLLVSMSLALSFAVSGCVSNDITSSANVEPSIGGTFQFAEIPKGSSGFTNFSLSLGAPGGVQ